MSEPSDRLTVHWGYWKHRPDLHKHYPSGSTGYPFSEFVPLESAGKHEWISPVLCSIPFGTVSENYCRAEAHRFVLEACGGDDGECASLDMDEHDARRLAACWNACAGIPTEVLEKFTAEYGPFELSDGRFTVNHAAPPSQP